MTVLQRLLGLAGGDSGAQVGLILWLGLFAQQQLLQPMWTDPA